MTIRVPSREQGSRTELSNARRRTIVSTSEITLAGGNLVVSVVIDEKRNGVVRERLHVRHGGSTLVVDVGDASVLSAAITHATQRAAAWRRARRGE